MGEKGTTRKIKSQKKYEELLQAKAKLKRFGPGLETSDPNLDFVRFGVLVYRGGSYLAEITQTLPSDERNKLLAIWEKYSALRARIMVLTRQAYTTTKDLYRNEGKAILQTKETEIIELFGNFLDFRQVYRVLTQDWGYELPRSMLITFEKDHQKAILKKKDEYRSEWESLKLSSRRGRLEELQGLYYNRKGIYESKGENRADYVQLLNTLRLIKDEVQDPNLKIEHHISGKIDIAINNTIKGDILKNLPLLEIIVGRVAAKLGQNPSTILEHLHTSIYSKFSGVGTVSRGDLNVTPQYPSEMIYDWNKIEQIHKVDQPLEDIEYQEVTESEKRLGKRMIDILENQVRTSKTFLSLMKYNIDKDIESGLSK